MNEVVPLSTRAALATRTAAVSAWEWFTDLGVGAWLLGGGVVAVLVLVIAVIQGRSGSQVSPCDRASSYVVTMESSRHRLSTRKAAAMRRLAPPLNALAKQAFGDDPGALRALAQVAAGAQAGHPLNAQTVVDRYHTACVGEP
jgi:hypothetical protein